MKRLLLATALLLPLVGCTRYYRVVDVETRKVYYSKKVYVHDQGSAMFTNAKSGSEITIRAADVEKITEEEFNEAVAK